AAVDRDHAAEDCFSRLSLEALLPSQLLAVGIADDQGALAIAGIVHVDEVGAEARHPVRLLAGEEGDRGLLAARAKFVLPPRLRTGGVAVRLRARDIIVRSA